QSGLTLVGNMPSQHAANLGRLRKSAFGCSAAYRARFSPALKRRRMTARPETLSGPADSRLMITTAIQAAPNRKSKLKSSQCGLSGGRALRAIRRRDRLA